MESLNQALSGIINIRSKKVEQADSTTSEVLPTIEQQAVYSESDISVNKEPQEEFFAEEDDIIMDKVEIEKFQSMLNETKEYKKGKVKRSSNFKKVVVDAYNKFFKTQEVYEFKQVDAQLFLLNNCGKILDITYSQMKVLNSLITFTSPNDWQKGKTPVCTARNKIIAEKSGISHTTVPQVLSDLENKGFIIRQYDKYTNQRTGDEPISLAPYIVKLSELADKKMLNYVVERRAKTYGRKVKGNEIAVTKDDKTVLSDEKKNGSNYCISQDNFEKLEKEVEFLESTKTTESVWDFFDYVAINGEISNTAIVTAIKKRSIKAVLLASIADFRNQVPQYNTGILNKHLYNLLKEERGYEFPLYMLYSLYIRKEPDKSSKYSNFTRAENICKYFGSLCSHLVRIIKNFPKDIHQRTQEIQPVKSSTPIRKIPSIKVLKVTFPSKSFTKYEEFLRLIKTIGTNYLAVLHDVKLQHNTLITKSKVVYKQVNTFINIHNIDLKIERI